MTDRVDIPPGFDSERSDSMTKRYPTRMHEVLGVETGEVFTVTWSDTKQDFSLDGFGIPKGIETEDIDGLRYPASVPDVVYMVNHPERITRRPRLTEEQVKRLRALIALEAMYLAKNKDGSVGAFTNKPTKNALYWNTNDSYVFYLSIVGTCLSDLVSWSDPEPLDIVQVLRENGCEVEG